MEASVKDGQDSTPLGFSAPLRRTLSSWSECNKSQPAADYDYAQPTNMNHRVEGKEVVGQFSNIRAALDFDYHGNYSMERQRLQDSIIQDCIGKGTVHPHPWAIFSAGAMGAGKGHTIEWMSMEGHFPLADIVHVDPDNFRQELPEWKGYLKRQPETAGYMTHRESGYCVEIAQEASMRENKNIWIDGSLRDGEWYSGVFKDIRKRYPHYQIAIIHVFAPWDVVQLRATSRAKMTGRIVPEIDLRQSFEQVPIAVELLGPLVDFSAHIENADSAPVLKTSCVGSSCTLNALGDWHEIRDRFAALPELSGGSGKSRIYIEVLIAKYPVLVFSKSYCSYCKRVGRILSTVSGDQSVHVVEMDGGAGVAIGLELAKMTGQNTAPQVFIGRSHIGGCDSVEELERNGSLEALMVAAEKVGAERVAAERVAAEKVEAERVAAQKVAVEMAAAKAAAEKIAAEKAAAEKAAAERAAAERAAAEKVEAERVAAPKVAVEMAAAEKLASHGLATKKAAEKLAENLEVLLPISPALENDENDAPQVPGLRPQEPARGLLSWFCSRRSKHAPKRNMENNREDLGEPVQKHRKL